MIAIDIYIFLGIAVLFLWNVRRRKMKKRAQCGAIK